MNKTRKNTIIALTSIGLLCFGFAGVASVITKSVVEYRMSLPRTRYDDQIKLDVGSKKSGFALIENKNIAPENEDDLSFMYHIYERVDIAKEYKVTQSISETIIDNFRVAYMYRSVFEFEDMDFISFDYNASSSLTFECIYNPLAYWDRDAEERGECKYITKDCINTLEVDTPLIKNIYYTTDKEAKDVNLRASAAKVKLTTQNAFPRPILVSSVVNSSIRENYDKQNIIYRATSPIHDSWRLEKEIDSNYLQIVIEQEFVLNNVSGDIKFDGSEQIENGTDMNQFGNYDIELSTLKAFKTLSTHNSRIEITKK